MGKMAEMQRKLLEQMMGPEAMGLTVTTYEWFDERVCRDFLFGTCPHILFSNTKMDLGPCPKVHSDKILNQFQEVMALQPGEPRLAAFRQQHENNLYGFIDDCDRRIRAAQRKLEKTPEENRKTVDLMREIGEIELAIQGGTEEIEALGEAGKVEESMQKLAAVDALKSEKSAKERELQELNENAGASGHQKLRVCEICGAMLSVLDSDKRLADHFGGKLHLGYQELRKLITAFGEARMTGRAPGPPGPMPQSGPPGPPMGAPHAPSGPRGPPPGAPSGPASNGLAPPHAPSGPGRRDDPHTPLGGPRYPPPDEMPAVGHGDKHRREAGELVEDIKEEKHREEGGEYARSSGDRHRESGRDRERERDRYGDREREREDRYGDRKDERDRYGDRKDRERERGGDRDREDRYEKYDKYESRSSRYDDRDRRERDGRERESSRKYDDDRSSISKHERSRSPPKRRLV